MASKRMSISALLSSDLHPSRHIESSSLQSSQQQLYRSENESVNDVDSLHKCSAESETTSAESHSFSTFTSTSSSANTTIAWYQQHADRRTSLTPPDTRFAQTNHAPNHSYTYTPAPVEQVHFRSYQHPSPPYTDRRYPEREQPSVDTNSRPPARSHQAYAQHASLNSPSFRLSPSEYREKEKQFPSFSFHPKDISQTDTSDSLLSVLSRTVASEGVPVGPGLTRTVSNITFASSPLLHVPSKLLRRGHDKDVEHDQNQVDRMREVKHHQDQRRTQHSPFLMSEIQNPPYHYHSDPPPSPEMRMLPSRSDPFRTPIHSTPTNNYPLPPQSPSRSQHTHINSAANPYPHSFTLKVQPHPSSHSQPAQQYRSRIENSNSSSLKNPSHSLHLPPRLDLTLPLSLSPATISGQISSPISPRYHPKNSAATLALQTQPRAAHYCNNMNSRSSAPSKEILPPPNIVGKTSNPTTFPSLRNQASIPSAAQLHSSSSSLPHLVPATNISSPSPRSPSFVLPLRPISPQQRPSFKRAPAIVPPSVLEPDRDTWEKNLRNPRISTLFQPASTFDAEATKRLSEKAASKRPISYDQRRVDESRVGVADIVTEKAQQISYLSKVSFLQEGNSGSLNDRGFKLWNTGPVLDDKLPIQRKVGDMHQSIVDMSSASRGESDSCSRALLSRPEESSLARISTLPLGTLPVPHFERPQSNTPRPKAQIEERHSHVFNQTNKTKEDRRQSQNLLKAASPKFKSLYPPHPHVNNFESELSSIRRCLGNRNETMAESRHQNSSVPSRVTKCALPQPNPEGDTTETETILQADGRSRIVSSLRSEHAVPTSPPRPPLHSSSSTDILRSTKDSEPEFHHSSHRQPSRCAHGSDDTNALYDSVQYPFPLPSVAITGSADKGRKESAETPDPGQNALSVENEVKASPFGRSTSLTSPNGNEFAQSFSPLLIDDDTWRSPGLIPANVHNTTHSVTPTASAHPAISTPILVSTLSVTSQYKSPQKKSHVYHEEDSHHWPDVEVSEKSSYSLKESREDFAEPVMQEEDPPVIPLRSFIDGLDPSKHSTKAAIDDASLNNVNDQSLRSLTNTFQPSSPIDVEEEELYVFQTFKSFECPLPSVKAQSRPMHSRTLHSPQSQALRHDSEEPIRENCGGTTSVFNVLNGSEVPDREDIRIIEAIDRLRTEAPSETIAHSEPGDTLSEDYSSVVQPEPHDKRPALGEAEGRDGDDVDAPVGSRMGEQSLEDELLSLVGDVHTKPEIKQPNISAESTASSITPCKAFGSITRVKTSKPRSHVKSMKSKIVQPDSKKLVSSSPNSGNAITLGSSSKVSGRFSRLVSGPRKTTSDPSSTIRSVSVTREPALEFTPAQTEERLYCVCCAPYDGDKIMIACDRCDGWYHPTCVDMQDQEVDLVDQFICEKCKREYPTLKTTYKARCYRGIQYISDIDKSPPCWKAAKGIFSKYCCEACGIAHMRAKIARSGKSLNALWPLVRHAKKREGISVEYLYDGSVSKRMKLENRGIDLDDPTKLQFPNSTKVRPWTNGDKTCLIALKHNLAAIRSSKDKFRLDLEYLTTRRRLLDLAVDRASDKFCGWDTRLEMGDIEWATWIIGHEGEKVLYGNRDENKDEEEKDDDIGRRMSSLCRGPVECPRHHGWKTVRDLELQMEVDSKNGTLKQLSETERGLKSKIEEIHPTSRSGKKIKKKIR